MNIYDMTKINGISETTEMQFFRIKYYFFGYIVTETLCL